MNGPKWFVGAGLLLCWACGGDDGVGNDGNVDAPMMTVADGSEPAAGAASLPVVPGDGDGDAMNPVVDPLPSGGSRIIELTPPELPGVQITSGEIEIGPGEEFNVCAYFNLPSDQALLITRLEHSHRGFMHHYVLHKAGAEYEDGSQGDCPGGGILIHASNPPVFPGTKDQAPFVMPDGVGYLLEAGEPMFMQIHMLNVTDEVGVEELVINLEGVSADTPDMELAGVIGGGDLNFMIPPNTEYTETQSCVVLTAGNVFALTSHSHERTVSVDISLVLGGVETPVYHSTDWAEPLVEYLDPPAVLKSGDGFKFSCTWLNTEDRTIVYGDLASDEMCIVFGYYYPAAAGANPCIGL